MLQVVAKTLAIIVLCGLLSCAQIPLLNLPPQKTKQADDVLTGTGTPKAPAVLDVATTQEREAAIAPKPVSKVQVLGETVVSLGNPAETGFWVRTSLISNQSTGLVVDNASGKYVNVTLLPLEGLGSGSQISLSAMRALGLPLTSLASIMVFQD